MKQSKTDEEEVGLSSSGDKRRAESEDEEDADCVSDVDDVEAGGGKNSTE